MIKFLKDDSGASLVEYGLLVGLIAVAAIAAIDAVGGSITNLFEAIATRLQEVENGL